VVFLYENLILYFIPIFRFMNKIVVSFLLLIATNVVFAQKEVTIIPMVQIWDDHGKSTKYNCVTIQYSKNIDAEQLVLLERFKKELLEIGVKLKKESCRSSLDLFFNTNYNKSFSKENTYELRMDKKTAISASSYAGIVYATRSLLQLFSQEKYKKNFPCGYVEDYPSYEKRMLMIDVARKFFTVDELKDFIRAMAWVKMNELHLHLSDNSWGGYSAYRLESEKYPELTAKDGYYSWEDIRELQDFAHSYGISIVPEIDSPGHSLAFTSIRPDLKSNWLTPNYLDITNKDTYHFMEEILDEVIPHFDSPDFHLGTDEYRINSIKNDSIKTHVGETFRKYINHFNKVVRKHGKNTRIWSGFEHMPGKTEIDNDITIDMWETSDAKDKSNKGYEIINSSHYYTYIVPGAPYYGVNEKFIYEEWTPEIFSDKTEQNLDKNSTGLKGSKMHIWTDFGPTGYSIQEIARLSIPSMMVFSEKMWGTKAYESIVDFKNVQNTLMRIPQTTLLKRIFSKENIVYSHEQSICLENKKPKTISRQKKNAEYPWKLELTLQRTKESTGKEVLLSSRLATFYSDLEYTFKSKKDGKELIEKKRGVGLVRANQTEGETPLGSHRPDVVIFDYKLPLNQKVRLTVIGEKEKTSLYVNGELIGFENIQMVCPLEYLGSKMENSFNGDLLKIKVIEMATDTK
jgi:hexosaminidase